MSALFTIVGSNVGYNSMVGIATSEMNFDETFCGFQLQLVCVSLLFLEVLGEDRCGIFYNTHHYNNVYMRRETIINMLPLQQHICK